MNGYDPVMAASDPRVVAVVLARDVIADLPWARPFVLSEALRERGITATEDQARALLDAMADWDAAERAAVRCWTLNAASPVEQQKCYDAMSGDHSQRRARLVAALDAICGSES